MGMTLGCQELVTTVTLRESLSLLSLSFFFFFSLIRRAVIK